MANAAADTAISIPEEFPGAAFALLAKAISAIGTPGFMPAVAALCRAVSPYDDVFATAYFKAAPPAEIFSNLSPRDARKSDPALSRILLSA